LIAYMWVVWDKKAKHQNTRMRWATLEDEYDEWFDNFTKWS
jgi:hypothetical protein